MSIAAYRNKMTQHHKHIAVIKTVHYKI